MAPVDLAEISFFELDHLFSDSAKAFQRKLKRKKRKNKALQEGDDAVIAVETEGTLAKIPGRSASRSATPDKKRPKFSKVPAFGGFTGCIEKADKTVVVSGVPPAVDEKALYILFSKCGTVGDVHILQNRNEARTGVAVVEFQEDEAVTRATLMGPPLNEIAGSILNIKRPETAKEGAKDAGKPVLPKKLVMTRSQFTQQMLNGIKEKGFNDGPKDGPSFKKLWIKNLRPVVTEEDMQGIFKPFGEFADFKMGNMECWITFQNHNDAQDAMGSMQGFQLVGQELQIVMQSIDAPPPPIIPPPPPVSMESLESQINRDTDFGSGANADGAGRIELMKKLAGGVPGVAGSVVVPPPPPAKSGAPPPPPPPGGAAQALPPTPKPGGPMARTLLLQNMFSPSEVSVQKDPKFYEEIREDTNEECSKFGKVLHVTVDPRGASGLIYVLYESAGQRQAAEHALNGRWFEGKKIMAAGIDDTIWQALAAQAGGGKNPMA